MYFKDDIKQVISKWNYVFFIKRFLTSFEMTFLRVIKGWEDRNQAAEPPDFYPPTPTTTHRLVISTKNQRASVRFLGEIFWSLNVLIFEKESEVERNYKFRRESRAALQMPLS